MTTSILEAFPDAGALAGAVRRGAVRAEAVAEATLAAIERLDPTVGAFLHVAADHALAAARRTDRIVREGGDPGPLAGVPIALKDLFVTREIPTTAGSRILAGYVPPYDGHAASALARAGATLVGKVTLDEFGMGSNGANSPFPAPRHPTSADHWPGGSSSGSAAAVAFGLTPLALGTDTGGSVRWPASCAGIVGLKPTYGRISRHGMIAFASSLDQAGPMGRTVRCVAHLLAVLAGRDERDATSLDAPVGDYLAACETPVAGRTVGVVRRALDAEGVHPAVRKTVEDTVRALEARGAKAIPLDLPSMDLWVPTYYVLACAEAASNLARYDGMRYGRRVEGRDLAETIARTRAQGFGPEVRRRILVGTYVLRKDNVDAYYGAAMRARAAIAAELRGALDRCDVLALPVGPQPAVRRDAGAGADDPLADYLRDVFTVAANLAGLPAIAVPAGHADEGGHRLPIGVQLVGRPLGEPDLFAFAAAVEREIGAGPPPLREATP